MLIPFGILSAAAAKVSIPGVAGYVMGGFETAAVTTVDKFAFPSDSRTTLGTGLSAATYGLAGFANAQVAGYSAAGEVGSGPGTTTVNKFAFPADTRSTLGTGTTNAIRFPAGMSNALVAGYVGGGVGGSPDIRRDTVDKFAFPSDTRSTLGTGLSQARYFLAGFANSGVAGYFAAGNDGSAFSTTDRVDKFAFPSDTRSTLSLSVANSIGAGFANSGVAGYHAGGQIYTTTFVKTAIVDKFAFPSDTRTTLGTGLSAAKSAPSGSADSGIAGYVAGGETTVRVTTVDKFAFPSDTRSTLGTGLSAARDNSAGMANEGIS